MTVSTFDRDAGTAVALLDPALDAATAERLRTRAHWVRFVTVDDVASEPSAALAIAAGPGLFLLDALDAGLPVVVPRCAETTRYVKEGAGFLTPPDADAMADAVLRIVAVAPAARRVMGRIGRNHLLQLVG